MPDRTISAIAETPAGAFGTLKALARRLNPVWDGYPISIDGALSRHEAGFAVEGHPVRPDADEGRAKAEAARAARRRANAHATYDSVVGPHERALDAALAVVEAELARVRAECDAQAEALKAIRLYSTDAESRAEANRGLEARAEGFACRARLPRAAALGRG